MHTFAHRDLTNQWRTSAGWLAKKLPVLTWPTVIVVYQICKRQPMPDPGNAIGAAKACIDAVVEQKKLPGDTGRYVAELRFVAPRKGDHDALILEFWPC